MAIWRYFGKLAQAKSRDEIRQQQIEGWNPWQCPWRPSEQPDIVVPDCDNPLQFRHAQTHWVELDGTILSFAEYVDDSDYRYFYVPATPEEDGAFEAREARYEGFWRLLKDGAEDLPWPEPDTNWTDGPSFLDALDLVEATAERVAYRGISLCRLCACHNGSQSLRVIEWEWPAGFRHYVAAHHLRPTEKFEGFIRDYSRHFQK